MTMKKILFLMLLCCGICHVQAQNAVPVPEAVDLGLSVKWASFNLGAEKPEEHGWPFAWGETRTKVVYAQSNYQYFTPAYSYEDEDGFRIDVPDTYKDLGEDISGTDYDIAHIVLKDGWRMPTKSEFQELIDACDYIKVEKHGMPGIKFTAPNGRWIFLPFAADHHVQYWSSTADEGSLARAFTSNAYMEYVDRYREGLIRPVLPYTGEEHLSNTGEPRLQVEDIIPPVIPESMEPTDDKVYDVVEQMPSFPGGEGALLQYISTHVQFPADAVELCAQGRVIVGFVVGKDGALSDAKIIKSVEPSLDKEAICVIMSMPKWNPGKQNGKPVSVRYSVPFAFRLQ